MVKNLEKAVSVRDFQNAENTDFTDKEQVQKLKNEIKKLRSEGLGKEYPLVINGEEFYTDDKNDSKNGLRSGIRTRPTFRSQSGRCYQTELTGDNF